MARRFSFRRSLPAQAGFAVYARLLEEAATLASADAGYPPDWYATHATAWVIRRSTIECATAIPPGVALEIATWVADFRRVRSRREYTVRLPGEPVALLTAHTDWVYVDAASGRPRRIPHEMMRAFVPEGDSPPLPRPDLEVPEPPADACALELVVEDADVDALDHVNNAKYLDYIEAARRTMAGEGCRARRHELEYLDEARIGDRLRCRIWALRSAAGDVETAAEIRRANDETLLTRARSAWAS
jgi:acyl-CoA thioester hydrolase